MGSHTFARTRFCEVCFTSQSPDRDGWAPHVSPICAGDDDDDQAGGRRRPNPVAPSGAPREMENA
jgi:hypothetical protein